MELNDLVNRKSQWSKGEGPRSNIVISTRVRLARNVKDHIYFYRASAPQREELMQLVLEAAKKCDHFKDALYLKMKELSELDRLFLVERHLMSPGHMRNTAFKALVIDPEETASLMVNEEDHLRMQVLRPGFDLIEAWRIADGIDTELSKHLSYDYSNKFGYLSSCPTNTGTALRASVMLHLPGLVLTGQIDNVFEGISKLGLTMRGFYGEGTDAEGDFFQISNQTALGRAELEIIDNLERILNKIISREESTRSMMYTRQHEELTDRVMRSHGTLRNARIITSDETIKLLSAIRLGADMGLIKDLDAASINEILLLAHPAHLQKSVGKTLSSSERDMRRADLIREKLK